MRLGANSPNWTTPATLRERLSRRWDRGDFLTSIAVPPEQPLFPLRIPLRIPKPQEITDNFSNVCEWVSAWQRQPTVQLEWQQTKHRVFGANAIPVAVIFQSIQYLARFLDVQNERERFEALVENTRHRLPTIIPWLAQYSRKALELADDWNRLLATVEWLYENPRPGIYVRQMPVLGVHTKFIEAHRDVLAEWLDATLNPEAIDTSARGTQGFCQRYGFRDKPQRIRFRLLDRGKVQIPEQLGSDLTIDADTFAQFAPSVSRVFITENEVNFLAFPELPDSLIVFGSGYGWSSLAKASWLKVCRVFYWGDIDTHGFAILDQLRLYLPHTESFMMDRATFEAFRALWVTEPQPTRRDLPRLSETEAALYDDVRYNRLSPNIRLEQERIEFSWVTMKLDAIQTDC